MYCRTTELPKTNKALKTFICDKARTKLDELGHITVSIKSSIFKSIDIQHVSNIHQILDIVNEVVEDSLSISGK